MDTAKEMSDSRIVETAKAGFSRPLLLSAAGDFRVYIMSILGRVMLFGITCASVLAVLLIFLFVVKEAAGFVFPGTVEESLSRIGRFLGSRQWYPQADNPQFGAVALIAGSLYVTAGALLFAVPTGLAAAVFLSDIAPFKLGQILKPVIELLAAIPSVAYGFFAVLVLAPWMQKHLGFTTGTNALNASLILAVMAVPTIISVAEDSLSAAGAEIRQASYGLGATRAETMLRVVMPASHSGIIAAVILGMMRAIGETMVVWMASGNANRIPSPWWDLSQSIRTMTATIAGDMGETPKGSLHYMVLFTVGLLLLVFTFVLNLVSEYFMSKMRKSSGGK